MTYFQHTQIKLLCTYITYNFINENKVGNQEEVV